MQRVTISIDEPLADAFDRMIKAKAYESRSEAMRDVLRETLTAWRDEGEGDHPCVANFSYIYNRQTRSLAQRLSNLQHAHHDLIAAITQVHLDHDHTLESVMMKGRAKEVRAFSDKVRAERGVRFGALNLVGVDLNHHHQPHAHHHADLAHLSPSTV